MYMRVSQGSCCLTTQALTWRDPDTRASPPDSPPPEGAGQLWPVSAMWVSCILPLTSHASCNRLGKSRCPHSTPCRGARSHQMQFAFHRNIKPGQMRWGRWLSARPSWPPSGPPLPAEMGPRKLHRWGGGTSLSPIIPSRDCGRTHSRPGRM